MIKYFLFFLVSLGILNQNFLFSEEKEIKVLLKTEEKLSPLYLGEWQISNSDFSKVYLKELRSILQYDLNYNGFTKVIAPNDPFEKILSHKEPHLAFNQANWKNYGVSYVIKLEVEKNQTSIYVFSSKEGSLKEVKGIPLSGKLTYDRSAMHQLADSIQKTLFHVEGIASHYLLYSVKTTNSDQENWNAEIWKCDWDGATAHPVTQEESCNITPVSISKTSSQFMDRFLYVSYKAGQPKIYIGSINEKTGKPFVDLKGNQFLPAISLKRDKMAFICDASGRTDLFVQSLSPSGNLLGKPTQLFTYPNSAQASPTFSPDGTKIAFVSDKDGTPRIYLISTKDSEKKATAQLLTKQNKENICPSWSYDGTKLAYSAKTEGIRQIWIYDFENKEEKQLTFGPGNKENPCWATDSLHIVFNSTDPSSSELFIVNLNQPEAIKITRGQGIKHYPSWGYRGKL